ncbi:MAG: molecular chaperone TorD family protein [Candidatus Methanoperedens sp.]|nr:molecular chaperone TorD family protein [Candidatus Methanoperedens sp.]
MDDESIFEELSRIFTYPETDSEPGKMVNPKIFKGVAHPPQLPSGIVTLQNEYVRLFINALPEVPCSPYASIYLEGRCMGEKTNEIKKLYEKYGLITDEIPDHIAVELEFLNYLIHLESKGVPVESDLELFVEHMLSWTPGFFKKVEECDKTGFYKAAAIVANKALCNCKER